MRNSYRVKFAGGTQSAGRTAQLAGIVDRPTEVDDPPVAVFSHCFTCSKDLKVIVRISRALAGLGIAVLRYDMTGLGGSEGKFAETNFSTNLADLNAAIGFAQSELGHVSALIGHSFGGAASLAAAASNQHDVSALVTLASPSDTQHLAVMLARMNPQIERDGAGEVLIGGRVYRINQQMLDDFRTHDLTKLIPDVRAQALLVHSLADQTVSFDHALRLMNLLGLSDQDASSVSLVSLPGADHLLTDPDDITFVASVVAAFIQRHCQPS